MNLASNDLLHIHKLPKIHSDSKPFLCLYEDFRNYFYCHKKGTVNLNPYMLFREKLLL